MAHTIKTTTASVNISMKTDSSRHVTLIPDKPACVKPSFTTANCCHAKYTTQQAAQVDFSGQIQKVECKSCLQQKCPFLAFLFFLKI